MLEQVTRYGTITLIALMVWLYAEGATRRPHKQAFNVVFVPGPNQKLMIEPSVQQVEVELRCASSQIAQIKEAAETPIEIEVSDVTGKAVKEINLLQELPVHQRLIRLGLTIERMDPDSVPLRVEQLKTVTVPIELAMPPELELAGPATLTPATAEVTVPVSLATQGLKLIAPLDANTLAGVVPGVPTDREDIAVTLPASLASVSPAPTFTPDKVKVTFTVKKKEDELVLNLVPVVLALAPNLARQYDVVIDQENLLLRDVKLKGPSDYIARIKSGQFRVEALLRLDPEDLEKKQVSKLPELRLPPGVTNDSPPSLIKVTITKRESVPPAP